MTASQKMPFFRFSLHSNNAILPQIFSRYKKDLHMKFYIVFISAFLSLSISAGSYFSRDYSPKLKIASKEILQKRSLEKEHLKSEFFEITKFLEIYGDKEMTLNTLQSNFDTITHNMRIFLGNQLDKEKKNMSEERYTHYMKDLPDQVKKQMESIKPILLGILLEEEYPEIYAQLTAQLPK